MILLLGGTTEGRELAAELSRHGYNYLLSVVSSLGVRLAEDNSEKILCGGLDQAGLVDVLRERGVRLVIDATHPHAAVVKANAQQASRQVGIPYLLYQRPMTPINPHPNIHRVSGYQEALELLTRADGGILFTIGIKNLGEFRALWEDYSRPVWVKVYPEVSSLESCRTLGIKPEQIFAFHGAGSQAIFEAMLNETAAKWVVTKESGVLGGTQLKIDSALNLNREVLLIERPSVQADFIFNQITEVIQYLEANREIFQ